MYYNQNALRGVAQLVEQRSPKPPVACSSRVSPAKRFQINESVFYFKIVYFLNRPNTSFTLEKLAKEFGYDFKIFIISPICFFLMMQTIIYLSL